VLTNDCECSFLSAGFSDLVREYECLEFQDEAEGEQMDIDQPVDLAAEHVAEVAIAEPVAVQPAGPPQPLDVPPPAGALEQAVEPSAAGLSGAVDHMIQQFGWVVTLERRGWHFSSGGVVHGVMHQLGAAKLSLKMQCRIHGGCMCWVNVANGDLDKAMRLVLVWLRDGQTLDKAGHHLAGQAVKRQLGMRVR
jgi:hypothetical protein